mmetsp:Transcript_11121/g.34771  ORF Transcript_11121/g.34771 Transcript_11121/m.34771 type:complete len:226 (-) Transcript_11121:790-1467(-)
MASGTPAPAASGASAETASVKPCTVGASAGYVDTSCSVPRPGEKACWRKGLPSAKVKLAFMDSEPRAPSMAASTAPWHLSPEPGSPGPLAMLSLSGCRAASSKGAGTPRSGPVRPPCKSLGTAAAPGSCASGLGGGGCGCVTREGCELLLSPAQDAIDELGHERPVRSRELSGIQASMSTSPELSGLNEPSNSPQGSINEGSCGATGTPTSGARASLVCPADTRR